MSRRAKQSRRLNPEDNVALGLQMLKTRLDNMPLTWSQREELGEVISMIARHIAEVVNERALLRTMIPDEVPEKKKEDEKKK